MTSTHGQGAFGVGNFGTATPVPLSTRGPAVGGGRSSWWLSPVFRRGRSAAAFGGRTRAIVVVWFARAAVGASSRGRASWWLSPLWHPGPASAVFCGAGAPAFEAKLFRGVPSPWGASGRALALLHFGGRFLPSPARPAGRTGALRVAVVWRRGRQLGAPAAGRFHAIVSPIAHAKGSARAFGRSGCRIVFAAPFRPAAACFSGRVVLSYTWSNLTAPGRAPTDAWAIPGASPDLWTLVPVATGSGPRAE